ncbi:MAG: tetratricopeptide repeat protein [Planctomycetota bacterium]
MGKKLITIIKVVILAGLIAGLAVIQVSIRNRIKLLEDEKSQLSQKVKSLENEIVNFKQGIDKVQKEDNQLVDAYLSLGKVYCQTDQLDKAIEVYKKAYHLDEKTVRHEFVKVGEEYFNQNRFEDSLKVNFALIDLAPKDYQHYHNAAVTLDRLGRIDEAIEYSRKAIDLIPIPQQKEGLGKFLKKLEEKKKIK